MLEEPHYFKPTNSSPGGSIHLPVLLTAIAVLLSWSCGNDTRFVSSGNSRKETAKSKDGSADSVSAAATPETQAGSVLPEERPAAPAETHRFALRLAGGKMVVRQGKVGAATEVFMNDSATPLSGDAAKAWNVTFQHAANPLGQSALGATELDFSGLAGIVRIDALFLRNEDTKRGRATGSVFVDGEGPVATLLDLQTDAGSATRRIYWAASDNYGLDEAKTTLIACQELAGVDFTPHSSDDMAVLPTGCVTLLKGADLHNRAGELVVGPQKINGQTIQPSALKMLLYAEDQVGLGASTWMTDAVQSVAQLTLGASRTGVVYTSQSTLPLDLTLLRTLGTTSTAIEQSPEQWSRYMLATVKNDDTPTDSPFGASIVLDLGSAEGSTAFALQARDGQAEVLSNKVRLLAVVDRTPPVVSGVRINVEAGFLDQTSVVDLSWSATDLNGITRQKIDFRFAGDNDWTSLADIVGAEQSYRFAWADRPNRGFELRVTAQDPAGNSASASKTWYPQIFNAALMTRAVQCLYCHATVKGDLGGIDFPADASIRADTAAEFTVTSRIYGTNTVPRIFTRATNVVMLDGTVNGRNVANATAANEAEKYVSNYANAPLKIFPNNGQFPVLTEAMLRGRMNGSLRFGQLFISRVYGGTNLVLDATHGSCIEIHGEVLIPGDIVLGGCFTGQGSLYASGNIFVINDIKAQNPAQIYATDPLTAQAQAKQDLRDGKDQLFLGALRQIWVGTLENGMVGTPGSGKPVIVPSLNNPYAWLSASYMQGSDQVVLTGKAAFEFLCKRPTRVPTDDGTYLENSHSWHISNPATDPRTKCGGMDDLQAYFYAQEGVLIRTYRNFRIMGGIFSPVAGFLSAYADRAGAQWLNPDINEQTGRNFFYFDERLKVGSQVGEALKPFFAN